MNKQCVNRSRVSVVRSVLAGDRAYEQTVCESVSHSVTRSRSSARSSARSVSVSVDRAYEQTVCESVTRSLGQSLTRSVSVGRSLRRPHHSPPPLDRSTERTTERTHAHANERQGDRMDWNGIDRRCDTSSSLFARARRRYAPAVALRSPSSVVDRVR